MSDDNNNQNQHPPSQPSLYSRLKTTLYLHYSAPLDKQFKVLRNGFILFAFGLTMILIAHNSMEPSIEQELAALLGLILGATGFLIAITAYIRFVISRLISFFDKKRQ